MLEKAVTTFHRPTISDGMALHKLISSCPPLDSNSAYCNLLQCTHFASTSILAKQRGDLVGAVSGYLLPEDSTTLFVWQVAVSGSARGQGIALRMLGELLGRPNCRQVKFLHTSVTPDNGASRALFTRLARDLAAPMIDRLWFARDRDFEGKHADEILLKIGPFSSSRER